jgi:hypothetical protein
MSGFLGKHGMSGVLKKRFVLLPFANKNFVFISKRKISFACFLRGLSIKKFCFFYKLVQLKIGLNIVTFFMFQIKI